MMDLVFLAVGAACFVLARMLPELWPSTLYWTRLRQRASL